MGDDSYSLPHRVIIMLRGYHVVLLAAVVVEVVLVVSQEVAGSEDGVYVKVGAVVGQVVQQHLNTCHLVLMSNTQHSPAFSSILRRISAGVEGVVVVESGSLFSQEQSAQDHLLQGLWGDTRTTCRALILDLTTTSSNNTNLIFRLCEMSGLWQKLETRVVVVGGMAGVEAVFLHPSFRNTAHVLYLGFQGTSIRIPERTHSIPRLGRGDVPEVMGDRVFVYQRCLYCSNGDHDIQLTNQWNLTLHTQRTDNLFPEQVKDLMGRKLRIVTVPYFPYMDFTRDRDIPGTIVTPKDSMDTRLIYAFAKAINFTFEIREEPNRTWGLQKNGVFTGMMGQLQREETDFCTIAGPSPERLKVVEYLRGYPSDLMTVTSLKPSLLPEHLSLIRPFEGELWLVLVVSMVAWGAILWLLQKAWWWVAGGRGVRFNAALLYSWGALLEQPPTDPSINTSGRMVVGWWLVFCLVITTAYRSSLIAHMTVRGKTKPLETFEDVVEQESWKWGTEPWLLKGVPYDYFSKHTDPVVQQLFKNMEVVEAKEALQKVLAGSYSLIDFENYVTIIVASRYTDFYGNNPFFISKKGISIMAAFGWGFRKGAPFYPRFSQLMSRLEDAGIISYWIDDVIARRVRENRAAAAALEPQAGRGVAPQDGKSQVVLGLNHVQGAFYLLLLGFSIAFLTLVGEAFVHPCSTPL